MRRSGKSFLPFLPAILLLVFGTAGLAVAAVTAPEVWIRLVGHLGQVPIADCSIRPLFSEYLPFFHPF
jgi:hypothetical protein